MFGAVIVTLIGLSIGGLQLLYAWRVAPTLNANLALQDRFHTLYEEDVEYIARSPLADLMAQNGMSNDASQFLNSRFFWAPLPDGVQKVAAKPIVDAELNEKILRLRNDWMTIAAKKTSIDLDLSFLDSLSSYDHWNIEVASPIAYLTEKAIFVPPPRLPIPEANDVVSAIKVRLIQGAQTNKPSQALQAARDFARLLLSTENLQLVLTGLAVLDHERTAYRYYVDELKYPQKNWLPIDRNVTRRAQRAILATRGYLRLWTNEEYIAKYFLETPAPAFCAVVNEAMPLEFSLRPVLEPKLPLEIDLRDEYSRLDRVFLKAQAGCRLRYLNRLVETGRFANELPGLLLLNRLPYSRKIFGLRLSTANFGGFDAYSAVDLGRAPGSGQNEN